MPELITFKINNKKYKGYDFFRFLFDESDDVEQYLNWIDVIRKTSYLDTTNNIYEMQRNQELLNNDLDVYEVQS